MPTFFEGVLLTTEQAQEALLPVKSGEPFETQDVIDRLLAQGQSEARAARAAKGLLIREDRRHRIALGLDGWSAEADRYFGLPGRLGFLIRIENEIVDHGASAELDAMIARAFLPTCKNGIPAFTADGEPAAIKALVQSVLPHWYATPRQVDGLHWVHMEGKIDALPFRNTRKGPAKSTFEYNGAPDWLTSSLPLAYAHALVLAAIHHERYDLLKDKQQFLLNNQYPVAELLRAKPAKKTQASDATLFSSVGAKEELASASQGSGDDLETRLAQYLGSGTSPAQMEAAPVVADFEDLGSTDFDGVGILDFPDFGEDLLLDNGRRFITFEGGEGTGKSTQAKSLSRMLRLATARNVLLSREPGGSPLAEDLRTAILSGRYSPMGAATEAIMFSAARADHMATKILPALKNGDWVVCDRFFDSTRAYQGAAGDVNQSFLDMLDAGATMGRSPDLTIILDLPAEISLARAAARRGADAPDRFEREALAFHERLRQGFLEIAKKDPVRCCVINCEGLDTLEVHDRVVEAVYSRLMGGTAAAATSDLE